MPKFKLEKNYNLVEALQSMGITALFDKNSNMTGISDHRITIDMVTYLSPLPSAPIPRVCSQQSLLLSGPDFTCWRSWVCFP